MKVEEIKLAFENNQKFELTAIDDLDAKHRDIWQKHGTKLMTSINEAKSELKLMHTLYTDLSKEATVIGRKAEADFGIKMENIPKYQDLVKRINREIVGAENLKNFL